MRVSCSPAFSGTDLTPKPDVPNVTTFESGLVAVQNAIKNKAELAEAQLDIELLKHHRVPPVLIADILDVPVDLVDETK